MEVLGKVPAVQRADLSVVSFMTIATAVVTAGVLVSLNATNAIFICCTCPQVDAQLPISLIEKNPE